MLAPRLCLFKAEPQDAFDAHAGEDGCFDRHFVRLALMHAPAGTGIFAFGVFADAQDVKFGRLQRPLDPRQQTVGADVGVLVKRLADRQQQPVQRHGIRHRVGPANGAQKDRIKAAQGFDPVCGHHRAGLDVIVAGPRKGLRIQRKAKPFGRNVQHGHRRIGHVNADAIAGDQREFVSGHVSLLQRA